MGSKYENIARHLTKRDEDMLRMSFNEIEALIEGKLPPAAYEYRAWWANTLKSTHASHGWMKAGWETSRVEMDKRELIFVRAEPAHMPLFMKAQKPSMRSPGSSPYQGGSIDAELEAILRRTGGVVNLSHMMDAIDRYIHGELLETELGRILRQHWPR